MIDSHHFFDEPVKNKIRIYDNIRKTTTGQGIQLVACLIMHISKYAS